MKPSFTRAICIRAEPTNRETKSKEGSMNLMSRLLKKALVGYMAALGLLVQGPESQADVKVLHTYGISLGQEVDNLIPVSAAKLLPLLPAGYDIVPATSLGIGGPDQGIVVIVNFRGMDPTVDTRRPSKCNRVAIDVAILVAEPAQAVNAGVGIPGAFHFYTLAMYTDDPPYAASLRQAGMPVKFDNKISYQREMNDASGIGDVVVNVPSTDSPFESITSGFGYAPAVGALDAVFWHDGRRGKAALHFHVPAFRQGNAISRIYLKPQSKWEFLLDGGGLGACAPDPETGYRCVTAPALNFRFDEGDKGQLLLIE
jgi:hypothetical protein